MWQRIQTLFFVLVIILMTASIILPNADFYNSVKNITYQLNSRGIVALNTTGDTQVIVGTSPCTYLFGIILFLTTYCIASFKNRKRQFRLTTLNFVLILVYIGVLVAYILVAKNKLDADIIWRYPVILPIIALIFNYLAMRGVQKDENLVRSLDRLR